MYQGYAQGKRITGKVTDAADGMPIIGATVVAVDPDGKTNAKSVGTITDINGTFTLNVPNGCQELKFSYVGMETKTAKITGLTHINVSLASTAKALDEVVVTALGVTREAKSLNYSRQSVNAEALAENSSGNLISSLPGKVGGGYPYLLPGTRQW